MKFKQKMSMNSTRLTGINVDVLKNKNIMKKSKCDGYRS